MTDTAQSEAGQSEAGQSEAGQSAAGATAGDTAMVNTMARIQVRLGDLGLAPENLRSDEPADDGVPQLAETILAAGILSEPIVRKGRKGEEPHMALDGRRRRFALGAGLLGLNLRELHTSRSLWVLGESR